MNKMKADQQFEVLAGQLADPEAGWSAGTFGAIAEFTREAAEHAELNQTGDDISVVTTRGGLRIAFHPEIRLGRASRSVTRLS